MPCTHAQPSVVVYVCTAQLQEVKLGVGYMSGGKRLAGMPSNLRILSGVEVRSQIISTQHIHHMTIICE
jgi:hypothetical protein